MKNIIVLFSILFSSFAISEESKFKVGILLFDGVELIDFVGPMEVFAAAGYETFTISEKGQSVFGWPDLRINVDHSFQSVPKIDLLLVPGGNVKGPTSNDKIIEWVAGSLERADLVMSVCTGSRILGTAGLLDGREMTTFYHDLDGQEASFSKARVLRDRRYVDSGNVITSAGLSSGIDAALYFVARQDGLAKARTVATLLEYNWDIKSGYVRGQLADSLMPKPVETSGLKWQGVLDYGDETSWHKRRIVISQNDLTAVTNELSELISNDKRWDLDESNVWRNTGPLKMPGQNFTLALAVVETQQANQYQVDLTLRLH